MSYSVRISIALALGVSLLAAGCDEGGAEGDAGRVDARVEPDAATDAGATDAGATDAGSTDAGATDAGSSDAGSSDAGPFDAGADSGPLDAGALDAGLDSGLEYDPCRGLACGAICRTCDPSDPECIETGAVKMCRPDGTCTATGPDCG